MSGGTEHLAKNWLIRGDDRKPGILRFEQWQAEALFVRRADQRVCVVKKLADTRIGLVAVQRHARRRRQFQPVVAPALPPDNFQCGAGEAPLPQHRDNARSRQQVLAWLDGAERDQPQRRRSLGTPGAARGTQAEDILRRRAIDDDVGVFAAIGRELHAGIHRVDHKSR